MSYVMVVDDDREILNIITQLLESEGYVVGPFDDSERALVRARTVPPMLVLVDLLMPHMSGHELIQRLRAEVDTSLPIIAMSASTYREQVGDLAIQDFITKPFDLDDLIARVHSCIAGHAHAGAYATVRDDPARSQPGFHQSNA